MARQTNGTPQIGSFILHALAALALLGVHNYFIAEKLPVAVKGIESSYWIFLYHFPAAMNFYIFATFTLVFGVLYLSTGDERHDRRARVGGEVALLCLSITLATGSTWARMAWGQWWVWNDPRLMSAAIAWLVYAGYITLQSHVEAGERRRRWAAVYGILAFLNIPMVHYAIQLFGSVNHPAKLELMSDQGIRWSSWYGVFVFFLFYLLIYRWKLSRDRVHDHAQRLLSEVRLKEEGALA